jgi:hypothetical protein
MSGDEKSGTILTDAELDEIEYRLSLSDGWVSVWPVNRIIAALRRCRHVHHQWLAALGVALRSSDRLALEGTVANILASAGEGQGHTTPR